MSVISSFFLLPPISDLPPCLPQPIARQSAEDRQLEYARSEAGSPVLLGRFDWWRRDRSRLLRHGQPDAASRIGLSNGSQGNEGLNLAGSVILLKAQRQCFCFTWYWRWNFCFAIDGSLLWVLNKATISNSRQLCLSLWRRFAGWRMIHQSCPSWT